jgi:hypothetical protein
VRRNLAYNFSKDKMFGMTLSWTAWCIRTVLLVNFRGKAPFELFLNFVVESHRMYIESYYKILLASLLSNDIFHTPACIKIHWEFETKPLLQWRRSYHPRGSTVSTSTTCTSTVLRDLHPPWRTSISTALQPSTLGWPTSMPLRIQVVRRSYIA